MKLAQDLNVNLANIGLVFALWKADDIPYAMCFLHIYDFGIHQ